jgi:streptogramin lyase
MASDARIGTEVAGYRIESLIGRGGMSVVYLAEHTGLRRKAALKLLAPELAENDEFRQRFIRESQIAAGLDHPNVIPVYDAGEADGLLYIAMRYVRGSDLRSLLDERGPLELPDVVRALDQIGDALDAAHAEGLVHRDVKPANVLLAPATPPSRIGHLYLADFGLTKKSLSGSGVTKSGAFVGTLDYVAPEQIRSEPVDGRADVYSAGCVLYECLAGSPPFVRDTEVAVMFAHLNDPPPAPTAVREGLPRSVDDVVARAMAKDPGDRFATAGELAAAARTALGPAATERDTVTVAAPSGPRGRRKRMLLAAGGLAVVVAIVLAVLLLGGGHPAGTGTGATSPASPPGPSASAGSTGGTTLTGFQGFVRIDPATGHRALEAPLGLTASGFLGPGRAQPLAAEGAIWVGDLGNNTAVLKLDPDTGHVEDRVRLIGVGSAHLFLAAGETSIWAAPEEEPRDLGPDSLFRIDPATDRVVATIPIGFNVQQVAFGSGATWVVQADGTLSKIEPGSRRVSRRFSVGNSASGVAVAGGAVWVSSTLSSVVYRVDPETGHAQPIPLPGSVTSIAGDSSGVWVLDATAGTVIRIDPVTGDLGDPIRVGVDSTDIAVGGGSAWVTDGTDGAVFRMEPDRGGRGRGLGPVRVMRPPGPTILTPRAPLRGRSRAGRGAGRRSPAGRRGRARAPR